MKLDKKFAEALTNALINKIKAIEVEHYEVPWFDNVATAPRNLDGQTYKGLNRFLLSWLGGHREVPVYMTFLRAKKEGLSVLSGEKSIPIQYSNKIAFHKETKKSISIDKYDELSADEKKEYSVAYMLNHYNVFNIEQTNVKEVKPELYEKLKAESIAQSRAITASNKPLDTLVEQQRWYTPIRLDQVTEAFYRPSTDTIHLPKREFFKSDDLYHSTMLHEMAHSTGHKDRLNREIKDRFGSEKYGKEELVAELSAAIVGQQYRVSKTILEGNAHYLHNWLGAIKQEPEFLNEVLEDVLNASNMIVDRVEEVQKKHMDKTMSTKETKQGKSAYDLQAQYSRINALYPTSVTTDKDRQVVNRIKQAEAIIRRYNENITNHLGLDFYKDEQKVHQSLDRSIYAAPINVSTNLSAGESPQYQVEVQDSMKVSEELIALAEIYSKEQSMTPDKVNEHGIELPDSLMTSLRTRQIIMSDLELNFSPEKETELLEEKMRIEDKIRLQLRTYIAEKFGHQLPAISTFDEKMQALEGLEEHIPQDNRVKLLHDGLHDSFPLVITTENTEKNRRELEAIDAEYEILPTGKLRYKGAVRIQEGYTLENTEKNKSFLQKNNINYDVVKSNRLYVSNKAPNVGAMLFLALGAISPVIGIMVMVHLANKKSLEKLFNTKEAFTNKEVNRLNKGETIRKTVREDGRKVEKYYFVDDETLRLRSIPVNEVHLPNRVNGISLSISQLQNLREGKEVTGYDKETDKYYQARLDLNNPKTIEMGLKEMKAEKEYSYAPKPNSPDSEKIAYVALHGAQGVNDIWELGGVDLERDSFLDKYDIEGFYKDYLTANKSNDMARAKDLDNEIKNTASQSQSQGQSQGLSR